MNQGQKRKRAPDAPAPSVDTIAIAEAAQLVLAKVEAEGTPQQRAAAFSEAQDAFSQAEIVRAVSKAAPGQVNAVLRAEKEAESAESSLEATAAAASEDTSAAASEATSSPQATSARRPVKLSTRAQSARPRRAQQSKRTRVARSAGRKGRSIAIKIAVNALEEAGYDTSDIDLDQLTEDLE